MLNFFDSRIPGLITAINIDQISEIFVATLNRLGCKLELINLKIYNIDYIPGERCRILYKLRFRHPQTGLYTRQLISTRLLTKDEGIPSVPDVLIRNYKNYEKYNSVLPVQVFYIECIRMIVYPFPLDLRLPWCFNLLNSSTFKFLLKKRWPQRNLQIYNSKIELLGYTPQTRASFFIKIRGKDMDTGMTTLHKLIGKIHSFKPASKRFADSIALGKSLDGSINLATPMGYIASENLSLQEEVNGKRLSDFVDSDSFTNMVRNVARAIAKVHSISVPISTTRTPKKEAAVVHRWTNLLEAVCPETSGLIRHLRSTLSKDIENSAQIEGIVHGDFHHSNILVGNDDRITLIDLDELSWGDPMLDVGRLMASLRVPALRIFGNISGLTEMQEAFLDEYMTVAGGNEKRIRLFEAVSLLISAGTPFRIQRDGWKEQTALLLNEADKALKKAEHCMVSVLKRNTEKEPLSLEERIQWAQDETYMLPIIDRHINEIYQADVLTCRVASERKTKRSYKIKYSLTGIQGEKKWKIAVRGIIRKSSGRSQFQILQYLLNNVTNSDSLILPYPVAYISPLSMLLLEMPSGVSLTSMIGKRKSFEMAEKLGCGLALFHNNRLDQDSHGSFKDELENLNKRIQGLRIVSANLYSNAYKILSKLEKQSSSVVEKISPVLKTLHPNHLVCLGQNIAFTNFEEVTFSHPLIDVGNFLATLTLLGIENNKSNAVSDISRIFYNSYAKTVNDCDCNSGLFEASAMLRIACQQVKDSDDSTIYTLLDHAERRLS